MKETQLSLLDYLRRIQYLTDEGFTIENMSCLKDMTIGIYVKDTNERYYFKNEELKTRCIKKELIDLSPYHGGTKQMVMGINKIIEEYENNKKHS